ncbi:MAG TPA: hypothetical protein VGL91_03145 [Acidobacteriota bacterium]|jgi:hypothetical protein
MSTRENLYLPDLMTGLLSALSLRGVSTLSRRSNRLDLAFETLFHDVQKEAKKNNLKVRFRIRTHPIHGDSLEVRQALYEAAQRDLVSFDNPEFQDVRLKISSEEALLYLADLPGSTEMYERLAEQLMQYYRDQKMTESREESAFTR